MISLPNVHVLSIGSLPNVYTLFCVASANVHILSIVSFPNMDTVVCPIAQRARIVFCRIAQRAHSILSHCPTCTHYYGALANVYILSIVSLPTVHTFFYLTAQRAHIVLSHCPRARVVFCRIAQRAHSILSHCPMRTHYSVALANVHILSIVSLPTVHTLFCLTAQRAHIVLSCCPTCRYDTMIEKLQAELVVLRPVSTFFLIDEIKSIFIFTSLRKLRSMTTKLQASPGQSFVF